MKSVDVWQEGGKWFARIFNLTTGPYPSRDEAVAWVRSNGEEI